MSKIKRLKTSAELLPPAPADMGDAIAKLVEQKIAEALGNDSTAIFQPFMQSRQVTSEIRKNQTVPEQEKWSYYFEEWGCLACGEKDPSHHALGMCRGCFNRTRQRMMATLRRTNAAPPVQEEAKDLLALAQQALAPSVEVHAKRRPGRFGDWSKKGLESARKGTL
jgi:hypothetical protein